MGTTRRSWVTSVDGRQRGTTGHVLVPGSRVRASAALRSAVRGCLWFAEPRLATAEDLTSVRVAENEVTAQVAFDILSTAAHAQLEIAHAVMEDALLVGANTSPKLIGGLEDEFTNATRLPGEAVRSIGPGEVVVATEGEHRRGAVLVGVRAVGGVLAWPGALADPSSPFKSRHPRGDGLVGKAGDHLPPASGAQRQRAPEARRGNRGKVSRWSTFASAANRRLALGAGHADLTHCAGASWGCH